MLKVFFITLMNGSVAYVSPPMPYSIQQCQQTAHEKTVELNEIIVTGNAPDGSKLTEAQIKNSRATAFACVESISAPVVAEAFK